MDDPYVGTFTAMAPALDSAGAVNFFGINNWGQVLHTRQSPPCSATWTGWSNPGFISSGQATVLAAGTDGDDHLVLVASNTKVYNMNAQFDVEMQQWSGWMPFLRASAPTHLALDYNSDGRLTLFSYSATNGGTLYCTSQMAYSSTEWQVEWTSWGTASISLSWCATPRRRRRRPSDASAAHADSGSIARFARASALGLRFRPMHETDLPFSNGSTPRPDRRSWRRSRGLTTPSGFSWPSNSVRSTPTTSSTIRPPTGS